MVENKSTKRRTVLKALGTGATVACTSSIGSAATGETYTVKIWQSSDLYWHCVDQFGDSSRAINNAKMHIEGAFDRTNNSVNIIINDSYESRVPAPEENAYTSFKTSPPCDPHVDEISYANNLEWWKNYHSCKGLAGNSDSLVLLTNTTSVRGGRANRGGEGHTVVQTGGLLAQADSYENDAKRADDVANGVEGLLHEVGHTFQMTDLEAKNQHNNENYGVHMTGVSDNHSYGTSITPLGHGAQDSVNECGDPVGQLEGFEQTWADCTQEYWAESRA